LFLLALANRQGRIAQALAGQGLSVTGRYNVRNRVQLRVEFSQIAFSQASTALLLAAKNSVADDVLERIIRGTARADLDVVDEACVHHVV
jgi:hypothetical protein